MFSGLIVCYVEVCCFDEFLKWNVCYVKIILLILLVNISKKVKNVLYFRMNIGFSMFIEFLYVNFNMCV